MKNQFKISLLLLGVAASAPALLATKIAQARPKNVAIHTPKPGSRERTAIMNALRIPVTKFYKGKRVTFTNVKEFRVGGNWAHLRAATVDENNKQLTPSPEKAKFPFIALLRKEKGQWRVVDWVYPGFRIEIQWAYAHLDAPLNVLGLTQAEFDANKQVDDDINPDAIN